MRKLIGAFLGLMMGPVFGATLLPNGQQQFIDGNGNPYASGKVFFYSNFPTCSILKNTWSNSAGTVLNTNPVILDSAGRATIFGSGAYCQVLKDSNNNTIWTKYTADTAAAAGVSWGGTSGGTANAQTLTSSAFSSVDGQTIYFLAGATNTGALSLAVNGGAAISVVKPTAAGAVFLAGGEVVAGNLVGVTYVQSTGQFQLATNDTMAFGSPTDIAAASTTDLNSVASNVANVTGSGVTITSFGSGGASARVNSLYFVTFAGSNTLTYNATSMILPNATDLQVAAGDMLIVSYLGGSNWKVQTSTRAGIRVNAQTGTTYTLTAGDNSKLVTFANASPVAVTLPAANAGAFIAGYSAFLQNVGSTPVTLTPASGTLNGQSSIVLYPNVGFRIVSDGANWQISGNYSSLTRLTSYTVSGTPANYDFTGVPAGVKRLTLSLSGLTISGATTAQFQFIVGGTPVASGYGGGYTRGDNATYTITQSTSCVFSDDSAGATNPRYGTITMTNIGGNTWVATGIVESSGATHYVFFGCGISLAGAVTGIRILPDSGTLTGGTIGLMYE